MVKFLTLICFLFCKNVFLFGLYMLYIKFENSTTCFNAASNKKTLELNFGLLEGRGSPKRLRQGVVRLYHSVVRSW